MTATSDPGVGSLSGNNSLVVAMLIRDPYATAAILNRMWSRLQYCVDHDRLPRDDEFLPLLTRLLYISCHAKYVHRLQSGYN